MEIEKVTPLNGYILVSDNKKEEQTAGGIYIPDAAKDDHMVRGTVLKTSQWRLENGDLMDQDDVAPGDHVMYTFTAGAGNAWEEDGITYRAIRPVEILAKLVE
jgi:co-chaperonin GroES (HSP10)